MVIITDAHGNIQSPTITENVYQGSNLANEIVFLAPLPQSNSVSISFRKPNGVLTEPHLMTPYTDVPSEYNLSGWVYSLPSDITELYGQVTFQIKVYNTTQTIATVGGTFQVIRGVPTLPTTPSTSTFEEILTYLSGMQGDMENGWLVSKGILPYDATFTYPLGATVYDSATNALYTSLSADNEGNALSNATYWKKQEFIHYLSTATVTLDEVKSIFNNGGLPILVEQGTSSTPDKMYFLTSLSNAIAIFTSINSPYVYWYNIFSDSKQKLSAEIITTNSVDQQLNAYSTWTVPSTKCVYDALATKQDTLSQAQQNAVNSGITTSLVAQIGTNQNDIATINGKIPTQASSSNQLADKNFVNSSIATNTANFIGTFANVTALNGYSGTITNNDYANVINQELDFETTTAMNNYDKTLLTNYDYAWVENGAKYDLYRFDIVEQTWGIRATNISKGDVSLITAYNRYTYNGTTHQWTWNYTVNTSGFTAAQWAAINSGATADQIAKIGSAALTTTAQNLSGAVNELNSNKQSVSNLVTSIDENSTDSQYPSAKCVYDLVGDINSALTTLNSGTGV